MSDERQQTRTMLVQAAGITGWVLFAATMAFALSSRHSLHKQCNGLHSAVTELTAQVQQSNEENKKLAAELAAKDRVLLEAILLREGKLHDQSRLLERANERSAQLTAEIAAAYRNDDASRTTRMFPRAESEGTRFIGRDGVARLRAMLQDAPAFVVEIGCVEGDKTALAVSEELRTAFEGAGHKVREIVRHPAPPAGLRGVSVHSKPKFDDTLGDIVGQIFREVSQEKIQWMKDETSASVRDPDIMIFVGPK